MRAPTMQQSEEDVVLVPPEGKKKKPPPATRETASTSTTTPETVESHVDEDSSDKKRIRILPPGYTPTDLDIICGRGKAFKAHPGNEKFTTAVRGNVRLYCEARKRMDRSIIVAALVSSIRATGAKFVRLDKRTGRYFELSDDQVHEKTGHAIRDFLSFRQQQQKLRQQEQQQPGDSPTNKRRKRTLKRASSAKSTAFAERTSPRRARSPPIPKKDDTLTTAAAAAAGMLNGRIKSKSCSAVLGTPPKDDDSMQNFIPRKDSSTSIFPSSIPHQLPDMKFPSTVVKYDVGADTSGMIKQQPKAELETEATLTTKPTVKAATAAAAAATIPEARTSQVWQRKYFDVPSQIFDMDVGCAMEDVTTMMMTNTTIHSDGDVTVKNKVEEEDERQMGKVATQNDYDEERLWLTDDVSMPLPLPSPVSSAGQTSTTTTATTKAIVPALDRLDADNDNNNKNSSNANNNGGENDNDNDDCEIDSFGMFVDLFWDSDSESPL